MILCISVWTQVVYSQDPYRKFYTNRFDYYLSGDYFKSESNFDANGGKQLLVAGAGLQTISTRTSARYTFFDRAGLFAGVDFNNVDTNNSFQQRTNSSMTYIHLGSDFRFLKSESWNLFGEVLYKKSNEEINVSQDTAVASDGADEIVGKLTGSYQGESLRGQASAGVNFRGEGLSTLLVYGFGADYRLNKFTIGVNFEGFSSVKDDENTTTPINRDLLTTRVNAGSRRYYSVNPNYLEGQISFGFDFDKNLNCAIYGGSSVIGSNSAQGVVGGIKLNWGFGIEKKRFRTDDDDLNQPAGSEPGFKVNTEDGVDQNLFKNTQPVPAEKK